MTFSDRVAVVQFATRATVYAREDKYVFQATKENKKILMDAIDQSEAIGATNALEAFEKTFEMIDNSMKEELTLACGGEVPGNTAILFLTDGEMIEPNEWTLSLTHSPREVSVHGIV